MKIGIIIQARMGSTRLPGKILKPFYGSMTLIETILKNLHSIKDVPIIVATTNNTNDDDLSLFLKQKGEQVFRGSENDVLDRFIKSAEEYDIDGIVRICSDNPFICKQGIIDLIEKAYSSDADYIGYRINNKPSILTHFGFWGEFVRLAALRQVAMLTDANSLAHEHVTYYIYNHPDTYRCEWLDCPHYLHGREDIRLTIDTKDDFENAAYVYKEMKKQKDNYTLKDVINFLDNHDDIKNSMVKKIQENIK